MQVDSSLFSPAGCGAHQASTLLVSGLLPAGGSNTATQALRDEREEESRREIVSSDPRELALGVAGHGTTRIIQDAERRMAPNSRAARQQVQADQQQQQRTFERTLADASTRSGRQVNERGARTADAPKSQPTETTTKADTNKPAAQESSNREARPDADRRPGNPTPTPAKTAAVPTSARTTATPATPALVTTPAPATTAAALQGQATSSAVGKVGRVAAVRSATPSAPRATPAPAAPTAAAHGRGATRRVTANAARPAKPTAPPTSKNDANTERILRVLRSQISENRARATLRLDPPELGTVKLHLDLRQDVLALRIDTATGAAHRLLSEHVESLRQGLEAAGIQLERVEIRAPESAGQSEMADDAPQPDTPEAGRDDSSGADTEPSAEHGTDSSRAPAMQSPTRELSPEPAAESLVNILA